MPLLLIGFAAPRFVMFILWIFTDYLARAFDTFLWPMLGFIFLPATTLGLAIGRESAGGVDTPWGLVFLGIGVLIDLGSLGKAAR